MSEEEASNSLEIKGEKAIAKEGVGQIQEA